MRRLLYVPAIHSATDLGSLAREVQSAYGDASWDTHEASIATYWERIGRLLEDLRLDYSRVKVYHDSIVAGGEAGQRIVRELAQQGSLDLRLTAALLAKGARLMRTEDLELLLDEYKAVTGGRASVEQQVQILEERDRYVAKRISDSLKDGETGILIMGAAHRVHHLLPADIEIQQIVDIQTRPFGA